MVHCLLLCDWLKSVLRSLWVCFRSLSSLLLLVSWSLSHAPMNEPAPWLSGWVVEVIPGGFSGIISTKHWLLNRRGGLDSVCTTCVWFSSAFGLAPCAAPLLLSQCDPTCSVCNANTTQTSFILRKPHHKRTNVQTPTSLLPSRTHTHKIATFILLFLPHLCNLLLCYSCAPPILSSHSVSWPSLYFFSWM